MQSDDLGTSGVVHVPAGPSSSLTNDAVPKREIAPGTVVQVLAEGERLNAVHWNIADGVEVPPHAHPAEQMGYVIKGALELTVEGETFLVSQGDAYVIAPNATHRFKAVGAVEAVDVFTPPRDLSTIGGTADPIERVSPLT